MKNVPGRVIVFQPALPAYRLDFFDRVSRELGLGLEVFYPPAQMDVLTEWSGQYSWTRPVGKTKPLFPGAEWQSGVLSQAPRRGDVVVIYGSPRNLSNMLMLIWSRIRGARTIWWGHYWSSTSKAHRHFFRLLLMGLSDAVMFYTDQEIVEYRRERRRDRRPIAALNNGINVEPIAALRQEFDARLRSRSILFIGRLTEKANLPILLRALADPRLADVTLEVIGGGETAESNRSLANQLGIGARVMWHAGTTDESKIAEVANRCRIFVYPGSVGLSLIHAMAYGLPAVLSDDRWSHMPEVGAFTDNMTGRVFMRKVPESLVDTLATVIDDVGSLNRWSKEALKRADTTFNTEAMAERFVSFVRSMQSPQR